MRVGCITGIAVLLVANAATHAPGHPGKVLILYSLSPDSTSQTPFEEFTRPALEEKLGYKTEIYTEYLDWQRYPEPERQHKMAESLAVRHAHHGIDVIVPVGFPCAGFCTALWQPDIAGYAHGFCCHRVAAAARVCLSAQ